MYDNADRKAMQGWVDSVYDSMSDNERINQLFMLAVKASPQDRDIAEIERIVREQKVGGVIFFKGEPEKQAAATNQLQRASTTPLFVAIDGEWGLSMRLSNTTRFPKNMMLGALADVEYIERYGEEVGRQCRAMGIHINFAPVLDVNSNAANPVIGIRSFGEDRDEVTRKALAYARGLEKAGVISCAKHFPGHGDTSVDSHHALPTVARDEEQLNGVELYPFKKYINSGLSGIMVAHLNVPALGTEGRPASLSREVVSVLLRDQMGFRGLVFTDGLQMKGAAVGKDESICVLALQAGNDVLVGPENPLQEIAAVKQAVKSKKIRMSQIERSCRKILSYKYMIGLGDADKISTASLTGKLNTPEAEHINMALNALAITVVKNIDDIIPLRHLGKRRIAAIAFGTNKGNTFHEVLQRYDEVDCFTISSSAESATKKKLYDELYNYDLIISSVHDADIDESAQLRALAKDKDLISVFFTVPYKLADFRASSAEAQAVVVAYEDTRLACSFAAQAIFGGIAAEGRLPVSIPGMFGAGEGCITAKTRLGYHAPEEVGLSLRRLQAIDTIVTSALDKEAMPGCRVLVAKGGMIVYNKSFGYMDYTKKERVTPRTVYDLASVSKATGTLLAVMRAYDAGGFDLNDKIAKHLNELQRSDKKDIVIRDMLYHQSGLPPVINFYEKAVDRKSFTGSLYSNRKDAKHPIRYDAHTYVNNAFGFDPNIVSNTRKQGFTVEAGKNFFICDAFPVDSVISGVINARLGATGKYTYSCVNFILLKLMLERLGGKAMDKMLDEEVFGPLGAASMTYNPLRKMDAGRIAPTEDDHFIRRQLIRGYVHDEAAAFQGGVSGNAGLFSTADDLAKVCQLYLNEGVYGGARIVSAETCNLFTGSKNSTSRRGLGFDKPDIDKPASSPCGSLAPVSVYGHTGFTGTCFWIDPDNDLIYIFLSNRTYPSRTNSKLYNLDVRTRIQDVIYKSIITENR
jgi:beta-glucosidase-like glycosyl hydrolase/CubicO group peptidase (beta-lactamase class C family)